MGRHIGQRPTGNLLVDDRVRDGQALADNRFEQVERGLLRSIIGRQRTHAGDVLLGPKCSFLSAASAVLTVLSDKSSIDDEGTLEAGSRREIGFQFCGLSENRQRVVNPAVRHLLFVYEEAQPKEQANGKECGTDQQSRCQMADRAAAG